jgi:hypothetical protein
MKVKYMNFRPFSTFINPDLLKSQKTCNDCKFFIQFSQKCEKFPKNTRFLRIKNYEYAISMRNDKNKCGYDGKYFQQNTNYTNLVPLFGFLGVISYIFSETRIY